MAHHDLNPPRRGRRANSRGTPRPYEPLERRVMLDGTVTLTDGTLEVVGTSGDDLVRANLIELADTRETVFQVSSGGQTTNFNPAAVLRVTVLGLGGDDNIAVRNRPANIDGGAGKDNLGGSDFGDILRGGSGDDVIVAFAGNDVVEGGDGNDTLLGLAGNDTLRGGAGDDLLSDTEGTDTFDGGPGTDTINGVTEGGPAELLLQAEDATLVGARAGAANKGYTGTGYADYAHARGDSVEFTFNAPAAGPRTLSFRYANGGTTDRPLALEVIGTVVVPRLSFAPTGSWAAWRTTETVPLTLAAGTNRVKLISIGSNGPNIDALTLSNAGVPPARPVFEAEEATLSGAVVSRNHPGYSGTGFGDVINASGDYVEWTVQGRGNFDQTIYIRYANGSTSARTMRLTISGSSEERMIEFAPTGSWSNWQTTFAEVTLLEGPVRVRLTAVGSSGPNIDWLQI